MSMKELIHIESTPAILSVNFEALKKHLNKELERYDVVVTSDSVKDAKALATELNTTKRLIDTKRKEEVAKASEPVKQFDSSMKELVAMCEDGRQKILSQVQRFEDETRELAGKLLDEERTKIRANLNIDPEFYKAEFDDLILITSVTGKGKLTASARTKLEQRVAEEKSLQDQTERRLLMLENQSYKAGLASPLTRDHVNTFLFRDDAGYQAELDRIIASEIERQKSAEAALRKKFEAEQERERENERQKQELVARESAQAAEETKPQPDPLPFADPVKTAFDIVEGKTDTAPVDFDSFEHDELAAEEPAAQQTAPAAKNNAGTVTCHIVCSFEVQVDPAAPEGLIEQKFMERMQQAGFQSLVSVQVRKQKAAA